MALLQHRRPVAVLLLVLLAVSPLGAGAAGLPLSAAMISDRAWLMVGHDPQRTQRSADAGPLHPRALFAYRGIWGPPLFGADGSVYTWSRAGFVAIDAHGRRRWMAHVDEAEGGPAVLGTDGLLRMNAEPGAAHRTTQPGNQLHMAIVALSLAGRQAWTIRTLPWATVPQSVPFSKGVAPLVAPDNRLYMPFVGPVYRPGQNDGMEVVSPTGTPLRRLLPGWSGPIALARNGSVYEVGGDTQGHTAVLATRPDGALRWSHATAYAQWGDVLVGRDGTVYASDGAGTGPTDLGEVTAFTPAGRLVWHLQTAGVSTLAERGDGVVLVGDRAGLSAFSPRGRRLWRRSLGQPPATANVTAAPSLAVDVAGRAYVGSGDGMVRAIAPDGSLLWTLRAGRRSSLGTVPALALGPGGRLAIMGTDGALRVYR